MALSSSLIIVLVASALLVLCSAEYEYRTGNGNGNGYGHGNGNGNGYDHGNGNGGSGLNLNPLYKLNPEPHKVLNNLLTTKIGIQGMVYCKSGYGKPVPIEGAVVRFTCLAVDTYGRERSPFSFLSDATDAKGYFLGTLCPSEIPAGRQITKCIAFLDLSPMETCNVPTDINRGVSGFVISAHHLLQKNKFDLFTLEPMFFTSGPPTPKTMSGPSDGY